MGSSLPYRGQSGRGFLLPGEMALAVANTYNVCVSAGCEAEGQVIDTEHTSHSVNWCAGLVKVTRKHVRKN